MILRDKRSRETFKAYPTSEKWIFRSGFLNLTASINVHLKNGYNKRLVYGNPKGMSNEWDVELNVLGFSMMYVTYSWT